jgi:hypothetical protein
MTAHYTHIEAGAHKPAAETVALHRHGPPRPRQPLPRRGHRQQAIHAITANAVHREARTREVQRYDQALPEESYGRRNREVIAARETRIAGRLRVIERAYRAAVDLDPTPAHRPTQPMILDGRTLDHELELE